MQLADLRSRLCAEQERLRAHFLDLQTPSAVLRGRSRAVDAALRDLWRLSGMDDEMSLVAVGGYGRGELFPGSDVDILILHSGLEGSEARGATETFVTSLWDIGLDIGHAVRTPDECIEEAHRDVTVLTSLIELRWVHGSRRLVRQLETRLRASIDIPGFIKAKHLEQRERHVRFQETPYSLEPNCKESPGGLRDLQFILWISHAAHLGQSWTALLRRGLITPAEASALRRCERLLQRVRTVLHLVARRKEDRLLFDYQEAVAKAMGIYPTASKRASEVLMQRYYQNAKTVIQLSTILFQNLQADLCDEGAADPEPLNERFQVIRELLDVRDDRVFENEPSAIFESFQLMQQHPELKGMSARTLRALLPARRQINATFRRNPENRLSFLRLVQAPRGVVHEFRRMNQYDILGAYLPAFGRIVGQMQHDLFHVYTVDQHILQVVRNVRRFTMPEFGHEFPLCSRIIASFEGHWLIYVAALFHDIAKGRGGDHSILGKRDARRFCGDHGLDRESTALVVWLVEHHLTMSQVAQKHDLSDPDVIADFAKLVRTERRLNALYILTVADIRATSPKVWNAWKGKLLEDLYNMALRTLRHGQPAPLFGIAERQEQARRMLQYFGLRPGIEEALWRQLDTVYFMRHEAEEIAWHTRHLYYRPKTSEPVVKARLRQVFEGLQVMVYAKDSQDLFQRLCGFFAKLGLSIADARIHTTRDGYALDSFVLLDPGKQLRYRDVAGLIEHNLKQRIQEQAPIDTPSDSRLSRQVKHFPITPEVSLQPDARGSHHILTVMAADRTGLLFAIARILGSYGIQVHTAKIATLGERIDDVFLVSGPKLSQESARVQLEAALIEALQT